MEAKMKTMKNGRYFCWICLVFLDALIILYISNAQNMTVGLCSLVRRSMCRVSYLGSLGLLRPTHSTSHQYLDAMP